ncbi:MAG: aspartyl/glutamyl-tRNA(Asn/Gln) amidotransferase subunit [Bacteroidota bacterium]|jgi:aspartyl-tRNA(Asn)/glutamyl-tRNA(Gln) amidotransferase subunit C
MTVDTQLVDELAHLSRLAYENEAKAEIVSDLNKILAFVDKLNEINTDGIEPLIYMVDDTNVLRGDVSRLDIKQVEALKNAPKKDSDFFRVPKVIEQQ